MEQGHSLTTDERHSVNLGSQIQGWGADLDGSKRPGVPRDKAPAIGVDALYPPIEPQPQRIKPTSSAKAVSHTGFFCSSPTA